MRYIYTSENCPKCKALKKEYSEGGIFFEERSSDRIKTPQDDIDQEALIQASMQNMELPVVIEKLTGYTCPECEEELLFNYSKSYLYCSHCDYSVKN